MVVAALQPWAQISERLRRIVDKFQPEALPAFAITGRLSRPRAARKVTAPARFQRWFGRGPGCDRAVCSSFRDSSAAADSAYE
jgi:hypothetical protein